MKNRRPRLTALADTTDPVVKETTHCSQRASRSKGLSPLYDGLLKFTFILGGNHNYYQLNYKLRYKKSIQEVYTKTTYVAQSYLSRLFHASNYSI